MAFLPKSKVTRDIDTAWTDILTAGAGETAIVRGLQVPHIGDPSRVTTTSEDGAEPLQIGGELLHRYYGNNDRSAYHCIFVAMSDTVTVGFHWDVRNRTYAAQAITYVNGAIKAGPSCLLPSQTNFTLAPNVTAIKLSANELMFYSSTSGFFSVVTLAGMTLTVAATISRTANPGPNGLLATQYVRLMTLGERRVVIGYQTASPFYVRANILTWAPGLTGDARLTAGPTLELQASSIDGGVRVCRANATGTPVYLMASMVGTASANHSFRRFEESTTTPGTLALVGSAVTQTAAVGQADVKLLELTSISTGPEFLVVFASQSTSSNAVATYTISDPNSMALTSIAASVTVTTGTVTTYLAFHPMASGMAALVGSTAAYLFRAVSTTAVNLAAQMTFPTRYAGGQAFAIGPVNFIRDSIRGFCQRYDATGAAVAGIQPPLSLGSAPLKRLMWHPTLQRFLYADGQNLYYFDADFNLTGQEFVGNIVGGTTTIRAIDIAPSGRVVLACDSMEHQAAVNSGVNAATMLYGAPEALNVTAQGTTVTLTATSFTYNTALRLFDVVMTGEDSFAVMVATYASSVGQVYNILFNNNITAGGALNATSNSDSNASNDPVGLSGYSGHQMFGFSRKGGTSYYWYFYGGTTVNAYIFGSLTSSTLATIANNGTTHTPVNHRRWVEGSLLSIPGLRSLVTLNNRLYLNTSTNTNPGGETTDIRDAMALNYDAAVGYTWAWINGLNNTLTIEVRNAKDEVVVIDGAPARWTYVIPEAFRADRLLTRDNGYTSTIRIGPRRYTVKRALGATAKLTVGVRKAGDARPVELYRNMPIPVAGLLEKDDPTPLVLEPGDRLVAKGSEVMTFDALVSYLIQS
jgi:hypothetical protein